MKKMTFLARSIMGLLPWMVELFCECDQSWVCCMDGRAVLRVRSIVGLLPWMVKLFCECDQS